MIRPAGPQDVPFLRDMLRHAYYWRVDRVSESGEPPVRRYVERHLAPPLTLRQVDPLIRELTYYRDVIAQKTGAEPIATLKRAVDNVKPQLEVKSRRVGGATYQVPVEVRPRRATTLAIRWIVTFSRGRRERTMAQRLANELLDASNGIGASVKRREDMHKMAESNKAFAHYRW